MLYLNITKGNCHQSKYPKIIKKLPQHYRYDSEHANIGVNKTAACGQTKLILDVSTIKKKAVEN
jgi:hypothetical protein